jgi:large subunit ribosomal protein L23
MILNKPIITEKSLADQTQGRYTFKVALNATKGQIASAFFEVFGIKALAVNTHRIKGKIKTDWKKRFPIKKTDRKIAVITVPKDKKIDILSIKTK